jgi:RNA polymerase sigma-70 factor, ECF subfamily
MNYLTHDIIKFGFRTGHIVSPIIPSYIMEIKLLPDPELLHRARQFDHQALGQIYDRFSPGLYRYAMRLLNDQNLAEDCIAETFTRFLEALKSRRGPNQYLQAYLYRTARNWITDYYRKKPSKQEALQDDLMDEQPDSEIKSDTKYQQELLRKALHRLTSEQQQVIMLKYLESWQNEEIAKTMNKPVGAVKSLNHRALARLKRILDKEM